MPDLHLPVLRKEVLAQLSPAFPGLLVDATIGLGGHAQALLQHCPDCRLLGIDRDENALSLARRRLEPFADRIDLVQSPFAEISEVLAATRSPRPVAILADVGCSSLQLDTPERGFSFAVDGPLDMRMGGEGPTAAELVNEAAPEELMRVLRDFGEERRARAIVRAVVRRREHAPLTTTAELSQLVAGVLGWGPGIHPATRTFQALRIAVNDELGQLDRFLEPAIHSLAPGGRLAVISFHSLEDRIVKHTMRRLEGRAPELPGPPGPPGPPNRDDAMIRVLTRRPIRPCDQEVAENPRSRSARLRVVERLEDPS